MPTTRNLAQWAGMKFSKRRFSKKTKAGRQRRLSLAKATKKTRQIRRTKIAKGELLPRTRGELAFKRSLKKK